jgi:hypothetical protein
MWRVRRLIFELWPQQCLVTEVFPMRLLPLLLLSGCIVQGGIILDDFNRPDGPGLGPNWTAQNGNAQILGNRARALVGGFDLLTYNGVASASAFVDVYVVDTADTYVALVLGYGGGNNYFIKVQNQSGDSFFHHYAFYAGNNSEGGGPISTLGSPFSSGRITASYSGTTAFLDIDSNFDGVSEQSYSYNYSFSAPGSGIGLGFWGSARADNFGIPGEASVPEPSSLTLAAGGLAALLLAWRRLNH